MNDIEVASLSNVKIRLKRMRLKDLRSKRPSVRNYKDGKKTTDAVWMLLRAASSLPVCAWEL